ncbi:MAG: hypothetical protein M3211_05900 [Actinomycetota bacterium]|nr:hypothetical protein [Actinomycetota bacterium]
MTEQRVHGRADRGLVDRGLADRGGAHDAVWMLVDLLASIVGADDREAAWHIAAMHARGSVDGQCEVVADMCGCDHPGVVDALQLLGRLHPDPAVAREARKSALRARTRALDPR